MITYQPPPEHQAALSRAKKETGKTVDWIINEALQEYFARRDSVVDQAREFDIEQDMPGWTEEELDAAIHKGMNSGESTPLDIEAIIARGRKRLSELHGC